MGISPGTKKNWGSSILVLEYPKRWQIEGYFI